MKSSVSAAALVLLFLIVGAVNSAYFIPISSSLLQNPDGSVFPTDEKPIYEYDLPLANYVDATPQRSIAANTAHVVNTKTAAKYAGQVTNPSRAALAGSLDSYGEAVRSENFEFGRRYFRNSPERLFDDGSYRDDARESLFDDGSYREE